MKPNPSLNRTRLQAALAGLLSGIEQPRQPVIS